MTTSRRTQLAKRSSGERGAVLVEAALILPIIVLLAMGLIEFSSAELQDSQATSAARDGARVGILDYKELDNPASAAHQAVVAATQKRATGQTVDVDVRCIDGGGSTIACSGARPDVDRLEVDARWDYTSVTAFGLGVPSEIVGTSRMALVGKQVAVAAPPRRPPPRRRAPPPPRPRPPSRQRRRARSRPCPM